MDNQVNNYLAQIAQQIIQKYPQKLKIVTNQTTIKLRIETHLHTILTTHPPMINKKAIDLTDHEQVVSQIDARISEIIGYNKRH